ncbi:DUF3310 domain-containing protein [Microaceticoccus formicicus]|uniref:DUF3310 domain-containing protein n=1 Tax=Microaceticoccus formicicus TaxID=3118105 RepID=UPI003CD02AF6|nr:DUF3310 domain-containing protein [Peptoniphilaceae bacterium AMB_02]
MRRRENKPKHYRLDGLNIETKDVIKSVLGKDGYKNFCHGNILKYVMRANKKNGRQDFEKAREYINWVLEE